MNIFKEIDNCILRSNYEITVQTYFDMKERKIDVTSHIKRAIAEEITKKIYEKIEVKLTNFKNENDLDEWYERWINNKTYIKYPPHIAKLESEFCVFTKKELYELLYSFNRLSEEQKEWIIRFTSPNKEEYLNQVRYDKLNDILSEDILYIPNKK